MYCSNLYVSPLGLDAMKQPTGLNTLKDSKQPNCFFVQIGFNSWIMVPAFWLLIGVFVKKVNSGSRNSHEQIKGNDRYIDAYIQR